jgi:hypothetical protein
MKETFTKLNLWWSKLKIAEINYEKKGIRPLKDWQRILTVTFFLLVILVIFSFYFYVEVDKGKFFTIPLGGDTKNEVKINNSLLDKVVSDINQRKSDFSQIKQNPIIPSDPSI